MTAFAAPTLTGRLRRAPILLEATAELLRAAVLLRVASIDRLLAGERDEGDRSSPTGRPRDPRAASVADALTTAARRLPWPSTCLVRALAGQRMLARRDLAPVVHLGVRRGAQGIAAHAWLEAAGGLVSGGEAKEEFMPIARIAIPRTLPEPSSQ